MNITMKAANKGVYGKENLLKFRGFLCSQCSKEDFFFNST